MDHPITKASINITRACNLRCSYCFTNGCTHGSMTLETAKKIVDFLFKNADGLKGPDEVVDISYWGGEPLLEWELIKEITLYAEDVARRTAHPVQFGGTTNGTLLTPDKLDFLDEHKVMLMISIDGKAESHDLFRKFPSGKGSHDIVVRNSQAALKRWPWLRARYSPTADRIEHFYEDMTYLFELGFRHLMFSPVYETNWTEEKWITFEEQCKKLVDYMVESLKKGRELRVEHFSTYTDKDDSRWPCGAGRFYVGFDIDGAIYPCHRFNKFDDGRHWSEKEVCIGHVDVGITNPNFRNKFIDFHAQCGACPRLEDTPCHGGCYAVNFDFTGDVETPYIGVCRYVQMQQRVSKYYRQVMPERKQITPQQVMDLLRELQERVAKLENDYYGSAMAR